MPKMPMIKILEPETIAAVWIPRVKLNNKVNFQITNEAHLYWCQQIIIYQTLHLQISQMPRKNHSLSHSLSLINNHQGLKNTGREILMAVQVVSLALAPRFLEQASQTQTCKLPHKKFKMVNNMVALTCNNRITLCQTQVVDKRKKDLLQYP
jgi:hypothetical protein